MLFEDRLIETHDQRSAKLWEKRAQEWKDIQARLSKKLGVHPSDLSFSSGDAYNTKVQEHQLLNKAALIHEKFGKFHWLMSLRGFNSNYVRVGHEFAGLFCRVREPILPSHELIVKPKNTTEDLYLGQDRTTSRSLSRSGWQQDQMFAKKREKAQARIKEFFPHVKQNLYELRENALVIQGTPLFEDIVSSGGTTQEGDDEEDFIDGGEEPHENDEEGTSREVGEPVGSGPPRLELSTSRMVFECFHGQSSTSSLFFHNCGSTALFFQWQFEDSLSSSPPCLQIRAMQLCSQLTTTLV